MSAYERRVKWKRGGSWSRWVPIGHLPWLSLDNPDLRFTVRWPDGFKCQYRQVKP